MGTTRRAETISANFRMQRLAIKTGYSQTKRSKDTKPVCWPQTVKETSCRLWFLRLAIVSAFLFTLTFICQCFFLDFFPYFFSFFFFFDFTVVATAAFCITDYCEILCHFAAWLAASFFPRLLRRQTHTHFWSVP